MKISIEADIKASLQAVWDAWVTPEDITCWNFAIDEWCCPKAELNLVEGGQFKYRMEARDGSMGFDYQGTFINIIPNKFIHFIMADNREVTVEFTEHTNGVKVVETFDAENENPVEVQREGWLGILNNFKTHVESKAQ